MNNDENSLANSVFMRVVSQYLTWSVRTGAYAANFHFTALIDDRLALLIASSVLRDLIYLLYGVLLYEIAVRMVRAHYRPTFICSRQGEQIHSAQGALNEADYFYRVAAEQLIYVSAIYYGFNLLIAAAFFVLVPGWSGWFPIGLGLLGGFLSIMNFFGVVVIASSGTRFSLGVLPAYVMGAGFVVPFLGYIVYTFRWVIVG